MKMEDTHPDDLLPWYVNGTLDAVERERVDKHLVHCARCRAEVEFLVQLRARIKQASAPAPTEFGLKRLLRDVKAERRPAPWHGWKPAIGVAIVLLAVQAVLVANYHGATYTAFRPLGEARTEGLVLQVRFSPDATEAQIRGLLQDIDASLVDGPGAAGIYRLRFNDSESLPEQKGEAMIARLRADAIIEHVARDSP